MGRLNISHGGQIQEVATLIWRIQNLQSISLFIHLFIYLKQGLSVGPTSLPDGVSLLGQARLYDDPLGPSSWVAPPLGLASVMEFLCLGPAQYPPTALYSFLSPLISKRGLSSVQPAPKLSWFKAEVISTYKGMQSKGVNSCPGRTG